MGPIAAAVPGQLEAVAEAVMQTVPVRACALGITVEPTKIEPMRSSGSTRMKRLFNLQFSPLNVRLRTLLIFSFNARSILLEQPRAISGYDEPSRVIQGYRKRTGLRTLVRARRVR